MAKQFPLARTPSHIAYTADSRIAFITLQDSNEVVAIDLATQNVMWRMDAGSAPAGIWVTPDQRYLLVGMTGADYVAVIDWRTRTIVKQIQTGKGAHNFRAVGDKRHLFLSNRVSGTISIIDQQTLTKVGEITGLPPGPDDMELTADGKTLWVTFRWARAVGLIDVANRKLVKTIRVGRSPHGIYFRTGAALLTLTGRGKDHAQVRRVSLEMPAGHPGGDCHAAGRPACRRRCGGCGPVLPRRHAVPDIRYGQHEPGPADCRYAAPPPYQGHVLPRQRAHHQQGQLA